MAVLGTFTPDYLIADSARVHTVQNITVKSGEGKLARGTILARGEDDKFVVLGSNESAKAELILASDVDASESDAVATAYNGGDFVLNSLIVADEYTISEADKLALKSVGIYIESGLNIPTV